MLLQNEIIRLRALEPEDLRILYRWENDPEIWDVGNTVSPFSMATLRAYIANAHNNIYQDMQIRLMIDNSQGQTVGCVDLYDFEPRSLRAGISLLIDKRYRGKQYAYNAMRLLEQYAFDFLHLHQIYAFIPSNNKDCISLFEKLQYTYSLTLKDWVLRSNKYEDVQVYQRFHK